MRSPNQCGLYARFAGGTRQKRRVLRTKHFAAVAPLSSRPSHRRYEKSQVLTRFPYMGYRYEGSVSSVRIQLPT